MIARIFAEEQIHAVVVGGIDPPARAAPDLGIISDHDLMRALDATGESVTAAGLAVTAMITVEPQEMLDRAVQPMASYDVTHVLVVEDGAPVGIVSSLDVARAAGGVELAADAVLADGTTVRIRPVHTQDEPELGAMLDGLSQHSRLLRFFTGGANLREAAAPRRPPRASSRSPGTPSTSSVTRCTCVTGRGAPRWRSRWPSPGTAVVSAPCCSAPWPNVRRRRASKR